MIPTSKLSLLLAAIVKLSLLGCTGNNSSQHSEVEPQVLVELQYEGGQISPDLIPKLQILEGNAARITSADETREVTLNQSQSKILLSKAIDPNFLSLDTSSLHKSTQTLMEQTGDPIPRVMDASTPTIRVWTGKSYHEVSFYAPRIYLRHSDDNPDLARFVELLDELEKVMELFP